MSSSTTDHTNPIALVTGACGGIGQALVAKLASRGVKVAAVGRSSERLGPLLHAGADVCIVADVTTHEGAADAMAQCTGQLGAPNLLAHLVGSTLIAPAHRTQPEQWRELLRVNLDSAFFTLAAWLDVVRAQPTLARGASSVFVSSVVARLGVANHEAIAAAKGGVEALVRSTAASYAAAGIRCNAVAPGMTETPMTAGMLKAPAMRTAAEAQYPLGGLQSASQVADALDWLLSEASARLTGQVLAVDGGFSTIRPLVR
jgi:NAD(P)-dependent dehydrogenase (short-subunit alcohol dehydrogenase family)